MKTKALAGASALAALVLATPALSGNQASINVSATVIATCTVTGSDSVALGSIDPSTTTAVTGTGAGVTYNCTKGTTPGTITFTSAGAGNSTTSWKMKSTLVTTDTLAYTPTLNAALTAGQGFGTGTGQTATVKVTVAPADFQNAVAHSDYNDTLTLTIAP